ncbi:MAG: hypothetical protein DME22_12335 [Verrucomicrobia bacterium]|nr:MAG: hypothetical protein DME22_12335 [Verrucomicrobiota bacterium]
MKKFALILGTVLVAAALVAAGWYVGYDRRVLTEAYAIPTIDKHLTEAGVTAMLIHQLDSARTDDARHMLRLQLDGQILAIDALLDASDARSRELAGKVFARIAQYRAEHPSSYTGQFDADVSAKIDAILRRAKESQK